MAQIDDTTQEVCTSLAVAKDNLIVASGYNSGLIKLWNIESKKEMMLLSGHNEKITGLLFTSDSKILISSSNDKKIIFWDPFKGKVLKTLKGFWGAVTSIALNNQETILASATTDKKIRLWGITKGWKKIKEFKGHNNYISKIAFTQDDNLLITSSWDYLLIFWDYKNGKKIKELKGHFGPVNDFVLTPDNKKLISSSSDGVIKLWSIDTAQELSVIHTFEKAITNLTIHPLDPIIAFSSVDNKSYILNYENKSLLKILEEHQSTITDITFNIDGGKLITTSEDGSIKIWDYLKLFEVKDQGFFKRAKEAFKSGGLKKLVETLTTKPSTNQSSSKENIQLRKQMMDDIPRMITLMKEQRELTVEEIGNRYNCEKKDVEAVLIQLLNQNKIQGSFNPFTGVLAIANTKVESNALEETAIESIQLKHTCFYCGEPLTYEDKVCPSCKKEVAYCPVCKLTIDFEEKVGLCLYCGVKGHLEHMKESAKVFGKCPVCLKQINWDTEIVAFTQEGKKGMV